MVDVAVSSQLQQWTFEKPASRPDRSDSAANSPDLYDCEAVRIRPVATDMPDEFDRPESLYQDRYLSSEEDLSATEEDLSPMEDDHVVFGGGDDYVSAKAVSMPASNKAKACDMAVVVSYVSAGRPKIVNMTTVPAPPTTRERPSRSASLVDLPAVFKANLANQAPRLSIQAPTPSKLYNPVVGPPSKKLGFTQEMSALRISTSSPSTRNSMSSPASSVTSSRRPTTASPSSQYSQSSRASFHVNTTAASKSPPMSSPSTASPFSPQTPSFLNSDPFSADSTFTSAASPIAKPAPHKRLRSLSRGLSLAKNAVLATNKKVEPTTPRTPITPRTPTAPRIPMSEGPKAPIVSPKQGVKLVARGASEREPTLKLPPLTQELEMEEDRERARKERMQGRQRELEKERVRQLKARLVPRGADEREPPLELPPCPDSDREEIGGKLPVRKIRKRRSLMDFEKLTQSR